MRAKKSLGQNFLRDQTVIDRIIDALDLQSNGTVVEIGPGQGALTERLIDKASQVIAIEFDRDLIPALTEEFATREDFTLINEDALNVDFSRLLSENLNYEISHLKLVANLPYNISTPILQRLIDQRHLFLRLVLMFQREVVERITAKPGGKERGFLSVLVENAFEAEYLIDVPPEAFQPVPKIWSAVVRLTPKTSSVSDETLFREIVSLCFLQKRKNILNNLKTGFSDATLLLTQAGIDTRRRAESLTLHEWARLVEIIRETKKAGLLK